MIRRPPRSTRVRSSAASDVYKRQGIPSDALTPDGLMRALSPYVDFGAAGGSLASGGTTSGGATSGGAVSGTATQAYTSGGTSRPATPNSLRKGLLLEDVEAILGPAATAAETKEGTLTVLKRTYRKDGQKVSASFVNGVLIDFAITPQ